jgi:hypothetical protein
MSLLLAVTLAAAVQPTCSWDRPGQNPYTGSTAAAIDRYTDIPAAVRSTLKRRIGEHQSDDQVSITRDSIAGKSQYNPAIRDMHFGAASVCGTVTRSKWAESRAEPAAVYCVGEHCILVPKICGNVSRISRLAPAVAQAPAVTTTMASNRPAAQFKGVDLIDPDAREEAEPVMLDELNPTGKRVASAAPAPGRVPEFVVADRDVNLDDLASQLTHPAPFNINIDNIHSAVPENETWAMLLGGLGLMGWLGRRRARASTGMGTGTGNTSATGSNAGDHA